MIAKKLLLDGKVSTRLRGKITKVLNKGAHGMFQWVALSLDMLRRIKFKPDFEKALGQLPQSLSALYDKIHERIEKTETNGRRVAVATLSWLLCAQRLLSTGELIAAVSLDVEEDEIPPVSNTDVDSDSDRDSSSDTESEGESGSVSPADIIRLCHNLVIIDLELDVFRFSHQSVREYLQHRNDYVAAESHALALKRCLRVYLTGAVSKSPIISTVGPREDLLRPYARLYWPTHYQAAEGAMSATLKERILPFFWEEKTTSLAYTTWAREINSKYADGDDISSALDSKRRDRLGYRIWSAALRPPTPLRAASAFGLFSLMEELVNVSQDILKQLVLGGDELLLLHIAAEEGHSQIVERLLGEGFHPDTRDEYARTPLILAAREGREAITKVLVENGADLNLKDVDSNKPLSLAAMNGHTNVVKVLLDMGADPNPDDEDSLPALFYAARDGEEAMVKLLLEHGASCEKKGRYTPLSLAILHRQRGVVQLLLEKGVDVEVVIKTGRTPLIDAVVKGEDAIVQMLLEKGANLEASDASGMTPLIWAASEGNAAVVKMLLEKGADLEPQDEEEDRSALLWAVERANDSAGSEWVGHKEVVKMLLKEGVSRDSKNKKYDNVQLSVAARFGDEATIRVLADKGADLEFVDDIHGLKPLSWAIWGSFKAVVELLVDKGVDVESRDHGRYERTPLIWAIAKGNTAAAKLLLDKGVDVESRDGRYGWSPLIWAVIERRHSLVELLLEKGADIESKDRSSGRTPLSWAAERGEAATIKLLLEKGADIESKDEEDGWTPLLWAAHEKREELFRLLLDHGAHLEAKKYKDGRTLLWQTVDSGWEDIVRLLLEKGFDADSKNNWGLSLREWAASSRQRLTDGMWALINGGVDIETEEAEEERSTSLAALERGREEEGSGGVAW